MPCVKRCCCCVTLRLGGITMGIMTLALSAFSIIPMAISFVHRVFLAQVVTHLLNELKKDPENDGNSGNLFVTVLLYPANSDHIGSWTPEMGAVKVTGVLWCFELLTLLACSAVCAACVGVGHHKLRWHHFPIIFNVLFQWLQKSWVFHFQLLLWVLLDQDITHLLNELKKDPENDRNSGNLFVTVLL